MEGEITFEDILLNSSLYTSLDLEKIEINKIKEYSESEEYSTFKNQSKSYAFATMQGVKNINIKENNILSFLNFLFFPESTTLDCYCKKCDKNKTFLSLDEVNENNELGERFFNITFECTRCKNEKLYFSFMRQGNIITKIGEYPSKYELLKKDSTKYRNILSKEKYNDYNKAIIIDSLGFSIGGFTYLRRIFEDLLFVIFRENISEINMTEEQFGKETKKSQFKILKKYLVEWINTNKSPIYGILSMHIHELTEDSAKQYFPLMKRAIDIILDKRLEGLKLQNEAEEVERELSAVNTFLNKNR